MLAGYNVYAVNVFDDSGQSVHFNDSRNNYSGIHHSTVLILTNLSDNAPISYVFSPAPTFPIHF